MAYDNVESSTMNRANELRQESQQDLPRNINISVGQGQPVSDNTTVNDQTPAWVKWAGLALQGIGIGAKSFAKHFGAAQGMNLKGFQEFGEGVADAYRRKRKEAEEANRQEEAEAKQKQEENTINPIDNDSQTAWVDYANKYWRMG